ncbi:DUF4400 domain-containing protein (plasmid) [Aliivibrio salmonicida]|uniref:DUF4400 domain-containing protein n=1 Tax=Aliivibrio salmonicida TaxID=40269 RepID=UPI000F6C288B|nr:DUF4400 domain-containing protein [Aliivibrio salmonicida]AZL83385.1 DUF4400 domain-containing protein [Aliivibrio salmonicida]
MLKSDPKDYNLSHRAMVAVLMGSIAYMVFALNLNDYKLSLNNEINSSRELIGENSIEVIERGKRYFSIIDNLLYRSTESNSIVENNARNYKGVSNILSFGDELGAKFRLMTYQAAYRISLLQYWLIALMPAFLAIVYDGVNTWRIKKYEFGNTSDKRQKAWMQLIGFCMFFLNLYFIMPFSGGFGALLPPTLMIIIIILIRNAITHVTKTW